MTTVHSALLTNAEINCYSAAGTLRKKAFHREGRKFLRQVATDLGLGPDSYDLRSNPGGIAVSGEVTLHAEGIYIQLSQSVGGPGGISVLYRSCRGRKDYSGGQNNITGMAYLATDNGYAGFLHSCKRLAEEAVTA